MTVCLRARTVKRILLLWGACLTGGRQKWNSQQMVRWPFLVSELHSVLLPIDLYAYLLMLLNVLLIRCPEEDRFQQAELICLVF